MTDSHPYFALAEVIRTDQDYAWSVFCNIAMPIKDSYAPTFGAATVFSRMTNAMQHKAANEAAAHLMQHLFEYDITRHPYYQYGKNDAQSYAEFRIAMDEAEDAVAALRDSDEHPKGEDRNGLSGEAMPAKENEHG